MWEPADFLIARAVEPVTRAGYIYRGLGLHIAVRASPKGRRPPTWSLIHLGSGHRICMITGMVAKAFPVATEIAECSDWEAFDSIDGWLNTDPGIAEKVRQIVARHPNAGRGPGGDSADANAARAVLMARLSQ